MKNLLNGRLLIILSLFSFISYILWEIEFSYYRYITVLEFISVITIVLIIFTIIKNTRLASLLSVALMAILLLTTQPMLWGRIPWQKTYFGVNIPRNFMVNNSTIIMIGPQPLGYLLPFFPLSDKFARINDGLTTPLDYNIINQYIKSSNKNLFLLDTIPDINTERSILISENLKTHDCENITTNINGPNFYQICYLTQ